MLFYYTKINKETSETGEETLTELTDFSFRLENVISTMKDEDGVLTVFALPIIEELVPTEYKYKNLGPKGGRVPVGVSKYEKLSTPMLHKLTLENDVKRFLELTNGTVATN